MEEGVRDRVLTMKVRVNDLTPEEARTMDVELLKASMAFVKWLCEQKLGRAVTVAAPFVSVRDAHTHRGAFSGEL